MGSNPSAHLAYGYDLGTAEDFKVHERGGEDGDDVTADWWINYDPDGDDDQDVPDAGKQIYRRLYQQIPGAPAVEYDDEMDELVKKHYGVELAYPGADESSGYVLIAVGSEKSVDWSEVMVLNLRDMEHPGTATANWWEQLTAAVEALGITPTQSWPAWLVYPTYG